MIVACLMLACVATAAPALELAPAVAVSLWAERDGIAPGDGGRTSLRLPDPLATGRAYYWHSRAQDGANTGQFSPAVNFNVFTPIVIEQPVPLTPINNVRTDGIQPTFQWTNAPRSGPVGPIAYVIELSDADNFANKLAIWAVGEQPNQTSLEERFLTLVRPV